MLLGVVVDIAAGAGAGGVAVGGIGDESDCGPAIFAPLSWVLCDDGGRKAQSG